MAGKSSQSNNRGTDLFGYFVSGKFKEYHTNQFADSTPDTVTGLTATGGVISDYNTPPGSIYRAHVFTSSGTFDVSALSENIPNGDNVEYLVVAGGGGGGASQAGGGGAGGLRTNLSGHPLSTNNPGFPVAAGVTYPVTIGSGGGGNANTNSGSNGIPSVLTHPDANLVITALGGGGGGSWRPGNPSSAAGNGGSGGGAGRFNGTATGGSGSFNGSPANPQPYRQGYPGGNAQPGYSLPYGGGGGGGAGGAGANVENDQIGTGGLGVQVLIAGPPTHTGVGATGPSSPYGQWFAGGGGAGSNVPDGGSGANSGGGGAPVGFSLAGGGIGHGRSAPEIATAGSSGTGGGGGGGAHPGTSHPGASGGSGIVIVRYQIGTIAATAKATGGAVSFHGGKTIHAFTSSGTFINPASISNVDYVVLAGGGGGTTFDGSYSGGAGGAGGYILKEGQTLGAATYPIQVGAGGELGAQGGPSVFNSQTAVGGGQGGKGTPGAGGGGGSGGGQGGGTGSVGAGQNFPGPTQQGHPGGNGSGGGGHGGGGGGFGGAGTASGPPAGGGPGGVGVQLPTAFRDPVQAPSDTTNPVPYQRGGGLGTPGPAGAYYVAGGGGGGTWNPSYGTKGGDGGAGGGGRGAFGPSGGTPALGGVENTGGGGGGSGTSIDGSRGGSGIVLIAYPS